MKILIIDDDQMIAEIWSVPLKKEGFDVILASNGKDGIDQAKQQMPNLILLDQIMPDMIGNDVIQALKADPQTNPIPVAVVSNYSDAQMMEEAIQHGATDYILKYQIDPQDLVYKVKTLIQEKDV